MTKPIKLGEFLYRVKVPVKIDPNKDYSLVTVKLYHKGVILREKKKGALLGSNMYRVSAGHFILSGIDARNGAFGIVPPELDGAIVTNDFWYFDVDETKVKRDFFFWLTNTPIFLDACIKSSKGETQRIRLQKDLFYDFEFHFPPVEQQEAFLRQIQRSDSILKSLGDEVAEQSTYLTQLRQAILQEAIEGKLTAEWRAGVSPGVSIRPAGYSTTGDSFEGTPTEKLAAGRVARRAYRGQGEDAAVLLEKIKAEKAALVASGKLKKEKPLPPIEPGEVPFALPEGWVWTRLGEICLIIDPNPSHRYPSYKGGTIPILSTEQFSGQNGWDCAKTKLVDEKFYLERVEKHGFFATDIIYARKGNLGLARFAPTIPRYVFSHTLFIIRPYGAISREFLLRLLRYEGNTNWLLKTMYSNTGVPTLGKAILEKLPIPLPPLAEQHAIVERVDKLLAMVDQLERQVAERKVQAEELMQAVLREAFG